MKLLFIIIALICGVGCKGQEENLLTTTSGKYDIYSKEKFLVLENLDFKGSKGYASFSLTVNDSSSNVSGYKLRLLRLFSENKDTLLDYKKWDDISGQQEMLEVFENDISSFINSLNIKVANPELPYNEVNISIPVVVE